MPGKIRRASHARIAAQAARNTIARKAKTQTPQEVRSDLSYTLQCKRLVRACNNETARADEANLVAKKLGAHADHCQKLYEELASEIIAALRLPKSASVAQAVALAGSLAADTAKLQERLKKAQKRADENFRARLEAEKDRDKRLKEAAEYADSLKAAIARTPQKPRQGRTIGQASFDETKDDFQTLEESRAYLLEELQKLREQVKRGPDLQIQIDRRDARMRLAARVLDRDNLDEVELDDIYAAMPAE